MMLEIPKLLNQAQLGKIHEILDQAQFQDGKLTAGMAARRVKNNQELKAEPQRMEVLIRLLVSALSHNETFNAAAWPQRMADPIFARYQPGMTYGDHVDDAIMGHAGVRFRSDVSMTIFLCEPDAYAGGELAVRTTFGEKRVKLAAGDAVVYPSSSLHQVAPVTQGQRQVALLWIQSHVRDPARRELLFELNQARNTLLKQDPKAETAQRVDRAFSNLVRMWAEV